MPPVRLASCSSACSRPHFALLGNTLAAVAPQRARHPEHHNRREPGCGRCRARAPESAPTARQNRIGPTRPAFLAAPVEIESAQINSTPDEIIWQNVGFTWQKMPMQGSIQFPATCNQPVACPATFTLTAGSLDASVIQTAVTRQCGQRVSGSVFQQRTGRRNLAPWPTLQGEFRCDALDLDHLALHDVTAARRRRQQIFPVLAGCVGVGGVLACERSHGCREWPAALAEYPCPTQPARIQPGGRSV